MRKFLHTTLAAAALFAVGGTANAGISSMDDLVGWHVKMLLSGTPAQDYCPVGSYDGEIIKEGNNYYLTNIFGTGKNAPLYLKTGSAYEIYIKSNSTTVSFDNIRMQGAKMTTTDDTTTFTTGQPTGSLIVGKSVDLESGYYTLTGSRPMIITIGSERIFTGGWHVVLYRPNIDIIPVNGGETIKGYKTSSSNQFSLYNYADLSLSNYEYPWTSTSKPVNSSIGVGINPSTMTGTVSTTATLDCEVSQTVSGMQCIKQENPTVKIYRVSAADNIGEAANAVLTPNECAWNGSSNRWLSGSNYPKAKNVWCTVPELAIYESETLEVVKTIPSYKFSTGFINNYMPNVSPQATIKIDNFGFDSSFGMYAEATLTPTKYGDIVESWELYVVPTSTRATAKDLSGSYSATSPTAGAILLDSEYDTDMIENAGAQSEDGSIKYVKLVPPTVIGKEKANYYTFFAKANLKSETGITEPVYGFVTNYDSNDITTGVDNIEADVNCGIIGGNGVITIGEAAGNNVTIYNISGQKIYENAQGSINVAPGVYIVKTDNATVKVAVK